MTEKDIIIDILHDALKTKEFPTNLVHSNNNKDESISFRLDTSKANEKSKNVLLLKYVPKKKYFIIDNSFLKGYKKANLFHFEKTASAPDVSRLIIDSLDNEIIRSMLVDMFGELALFIITGAVSDYFGCCARYAECSDAKKCIHPDVIYSFSCQYRKNLDKDKIFYGVNKNI